MREHRRVLVGILWGLLLLGIGLRACSNPTRNSVYPVYAEAGRTWAAGRPCYGVLLPGFDIFRYSPIVAVGLVPFGAVPDEIGGPLWLSVNVFAFFGGLAWFLRTVRPAERHSAAFALALIPWTLPNFANLQANPLMTGLLLAGVAACRTRRWNLATACLVGASLLKLYPIAFALLLAVVYPRRLAGRLLLGLAVGFALPFLLQDPVYVASQWRSWADDLCRYNGSRTGEWRFSDLGLLFHVLRLPITPTSWAVLQVVSGAAAGALVLRWRKNHAERVVLDRVHVLGAGWMILCGPGTESATYILLAPAFALSLAEAFQGHSASRQHLAVVLIALVLARILLLNVPVPLSTRFLSPLAAVLLLLDRFWLWHGALASRGEPESAAAASFSLGRPTGALYP